MRTRGADSDAFGEEQPGTATVVEEIAAKTKTALGMELDALSRTVLFIEVGDALRATGGPRDYLGVGGVPRYSTATSIADAADRILRTHVFEAIDMTYDQEVTEIVGQLSRLLARYSHCKTVAILVDMGSLERSTTHYRAHDVRHPHRQQRVDRPCPRGGKRAHRPRRSGRGARPRLGGARAQLQRGEGFGRKRRVAFCSESGIEAADKIRQIVQNSSPARPRCSS